MLSNIFLWRERERESNKYMDKERKLTRIHEGKGGETDYSNQKEI